MKFFYRDLWIPQSATPEQIKSAYRKLARQYHPDGTNSDASVFLSIGEAYQTLIDPERRTTYDAELNVFLRLRAWRSPALNERSERFGRGGRRGMIPKRTSAPVGRRC